MREADKMIPKKDTTQDVTWPTCQTKEIICSYLSQTDSFGDKMFFENIKKNETKQIYIYFCCSALLNPIVYQIVYHKLTLMGKKKVCRQRMTMQWTKLFNVMNFLFRHQFMPKTLNSISPKPHSDSPSCRTEWWTSIFTSLHFVFCFPENTTKE